jgi:hypothetical protein
MSKRENNVMKCGRCGQWIPLAQWKYMAPRMIHSNCAALLPRAQETPSGMLMRRRGGVLHQIR